jgi:hypothetical protein
MIGFDKFKNPNSIFKKKSSHAKKSSHTKKRAIKPLIVQDRSEYLNDRI